jgi:hypothetical protein
MPNAKNSNAARVGDAVTFDVVGPSGIVLETLTGTIEKVFKNGKAKVRVGSFAPKRYHVPRCDLQRAP